jgi:hypothetical protein
MTTSESEKDPTLARMAMTMARMKPLCWDRWQGGQQGFLFYFILFY